MKNLITECAKKYDADVVTITSADKFPKESALFKIFPEVKTVIGLGFRVLRGMYRGVEEGTVYYQYTTMGVENLEENHELQGKPNRNGATFGNPLRCRRGFFRSGVYQTID